MQILHHLVTIIFGCFFFFQLSFLLLPKRTNCHSLVLFTPYLYIIPFAISPVNPARTLHIPAHRKYLFISVDGFAINYKLWSKCFILIWKKKEHCTIKIISKRLFNKFHASEEFHLAPIDSFIELNIAMPLCITWYIDFNSLSTIFLLHQQHVHFLSCKENLLFSSSTLLYCWSLLHPRVSLCAFVH